MLQDPFLNNVPPAATPGLSQTTAMHAWLTENSSSPEARETPAPEQRQMYEAIRSKPELSEPVMTTNDEPPHQEQPLPLLIPEESLESAWLRVTNTPDKKFGSIPMDQAKTSSRLKPLWQGLSRG